MANKRQVAGPFPEKMYRYRLLDLALATRVTLGHVVFARRHRLKILPTLAIPTRTGTDETMPSGVSFVPGAN